MLAWTSISHQFDWPRPSPNNEACYVLLSLLDSTPCLVLFLVFPFVGLVPIETRQHRFVWFHFSVFWVCLQELLYPTSLIGHSVSLLSLFLALFIVFLEKKHWVKFGYASKSCNATDPPPIQTRRKHANGARNQVTPGGIRAPDPKAPYQNCLVVQSAEKHQFLHPQTPPKSRFFEPLCHPPPLPHTPSINSLRSQGETSPSLPAGFRKKKNCSGHIQTQNPRGVTFASRLTLLFRFRLLDRRWLGTPKVF